VTREELTHIADAVLVNWNMDLGGDRRKAFYRTWWRYLGDLDVDVTQTAVDAAVLADKPFAPRAGTIRRAVLSHLLTDVPTLEQAWSQAQTRIHEVQQGMWTDSISPMVGKALAESGIHGTNKDDHEAFTRAWRRVVDELELERLGLPAGQE
jgi:hypothetical protein